MTTISLSGGEKLERKLAEIASKVAKGATLKVGFLSEATYPDGTNVATVAAINNFGAPAAGIPARPFFTDFIKNNADKWGPALAEILPTVDYDAVKALNLMGFGMAGQLRQSIVDTNSPANSPVTDLLKHRFPTGEYEFSDVLQAWEDIHGDVVEYAPAGKPLVWSGNMLASVDHEVTEGTG